MVFCQIAMNEITCGDEIQTSLDEIFGVTPQMKSNPPIHNLAKQDFTAKRFIPRKWIYSAKGGFN